MLPAHDTPCDLRRHRRRPVGAQPGTGIYSEICRRTLAWPEPELRPTIHYARTARATGESHGLPWQCGQIKGQMLLLVTSGANFRRVNRMFNLHRERACKQCNDLDIHCIVGRNRRAFFRTGSAGIEGGSDTARKLSVWTLWRSHNLRLLG